MTLFDRIRRWVMPSAASPSLGDARPGTPNPTEQGITQIERQHFLLHLPFEWKMVGGDGTSEFEFVNQSLPEQLIATILLTAEPLPMDALTSTVERLAEIRRSAVAELSGGRAICAPATLRSTSEQAEVRCFGVDERNKVRFAGVVRGAMHKIVTVALTRYSLAGDAAGWENYASTIFDFLQLRP